MKSKDNLNKPTGRSNPKKKGPAAPKPKSFGVLGAASSMPPGGMAGASPMLNSPYNMQGMP